MRNEKLLVEVEELKKQCKSVKPKITDRLLGKKNGMKFNMNVQNVGALLITKI